MPPRGNVREAARTRQRQRDEQTGGPDSAPLSGKALAIRPSQEIWDSNQMLALPSIGVQHATSADLAVFFHVCQKTGLSPFLKQIYMIARQVWDKDLGRKVWKQTIQVGISGFHIVRDRRAMLDGWAAEYEDTIWYDGEGNPHTLWMSDQPPFACKVVLVKVYADGRRARVPKLIRWDAYADVWETDSEEGARNPHKAGEPRNRWKDDPAGMLEKCSDAGACRRAAPQDLSGIYAPEEMERGAGEGPHAWAHRPAMTATVITDQGGQQAAPVPGNDDPDAEAQRKASLARIHILFRDAGFGEETDQDHAVRVAVCANLAREADNDPLVPLESTADLNVWQADRVAERLDQFLAGQRDGHAALDRMAKVVAKQLAKQPAGARS